MAFLTQRLAIEFIISRPPLTTASILVSIPVVVVFLMLSKYLVSGLPLGSLKE